MPNPAAKSKAKPKTGSPKGGGKGKEGGSQDQTKAGPNPKGKAPAGNPSAKAKPKAESGKPTVKCLFYPNCNRGSSCPFLHEGASKAKAESKASPAKAPAKAAVATLLASSIQRHREPTCRLWAKPFRRSVHVSFQSILCIHRCTVVCCEHIKHGWLSALLCSSNCCPHW